LLTGSLDKNIKLHDLQAGSDSAALEFPHPDGVRKALWNDENTFLTGGQDGAVRVWDVRTQAQTQEIMCSDLVMDMELSADGSILTVAAGKEVLHTGRKRVV
jgi:WD40 repeat protein